MQDLIKAPDGAYLFRADEVEIIKDELGRPVVTFKMAGESNVKSVNGKTGDVQISCTDVQALPVDTEYVKPIELNKYLSLAGGKMDDMAVISTDNMLTLSAKEKAEISVVDAGYVFAKGNLGTRIMAGIQTTSFDADGTVDFGGQKLEGVNTPTEDTDGANKAYVDGVVQDQNTRLNTAEDNIQAMNNEIGDCEKKLDNFNTRVTDVEGAIASKLTLTGGTMLGNIDMNEYALLNVQKLHVDGTTPVYIGATIEESEQGVRLTGTTGGEAAFVKPNTQSTYAPVLAGAPTNANHLTTKEYVDNKVNDVESKMDGIVPSYSSDMEGCVLTIKNGVPTWVQPS